MVRAWYMEGNAVQHPRDEHHRLPPKFITLEDLYKLTGVEHHWLSVDTFDSDGTFDKIKHERGYTYEDTLETPGESELQEFYKEHLHAEEEIRFVVEGCGYYDIRDANEEWIRVEVVAGDLIVVPGGCYHRFMLDQTNSFKARRLFLSPQYRAYKRPADDMDCRKQYVRKVQSGAFNDAAANHA